MPLPPALQQPLDTLLSSVYNLQTSAGGGFKRYYSAIFRDLPDRRDYPDYYQVIREPRCLHDIMDSLQRGAYSSPQAVAYDLFLIWSNAREYNEQGSMVYADADKLESYMERLWQERSPPLPPFHSLPRPGSLPLAQPAPAPTDSARKVKRIKVTGASIGGPATPSASLAASGSTKLRIATPAASASPAPATPSLTLKLGGPRPSATPSAAAGAGVALPPLPMPAQQLPPAPVPADSGGALAASSSSAQQHAPQAPAAAASGSSSKKVEKDEDAEDGTPSAPVQTTPDVESGWLSGDLGNNPTQVYLDVVSKIRTYTDASGRALATPLLDLPDPATRPDYYQLVPDPVSLDSIEAKVNAGAYPSPDAFDRDLFRLFAAAKLFVRPETPGTLFSDLMMLQRLYQELTRRKSALERSAGTDSTSAFTASGPSSVKREDDLGVSDLKSRATTRPTTKDKIFLDGINFKGDVLRVGDWVHLLNPDNPAKPVIAQIWKVYKRPDSPQRCLSVCWYYRPEETVHPVSRMFYPNEVFKTGVFVDHPVEDFVGRCFVMFFTKYTRGRPKAPAWDESIPLYVCEYRYKDDVKSFKKIKSWNSCVPEEIRKNEYDFEPFPDDHVEALPKIKSPFVSGVAAPGGPGASVTPVYHFSQDGKPATAEEVQAAKVEETPMDVDMDDSAPAVDVASAAAFAQALTPNGGGLFDVSSLSAAAIPALPPSYQQSPVPEQPAAASPLTAFPAPASTPAELAAATEVFAPLPSHITSRFRNDAFGDLLWFTAPAAEVPVVTRPTHSLEYLYWKAQQKTAAKQGSAGAATVAGA
ncbi:hypothetical protein JCM6882_002325 [Rhodosporidiobolus microsporus]